MDYNFPRIRSGSKGEGLTFKISHTDVMFVEPNLMVYESGSDLTDNKKEILIMINESLMNTDHVMSKLTDKTLPSLKDTSHDPVIIIQIQKYQMELMEQKKIITIIKHSINLNICIDKNALAVLP